MFLMSFCCLSICFAQDDHNDLYLKKGKIIFEEKSTASFGEIEVTQYRIEQVELTKPMEMPKGEMPLETAFRIVVTTAKPLPFNDYSIWLDESQYNAYPLKPNELAIIVYAKTLPSGVSELAISKRSEQDLETRLVLPDKLQVPTEYATPLNEIAARAPVITLRRLQRREVVLIEFIVNIPGVPCPLPQNSIKYIALDGKMYGEFSCKDGENEDAPFHHLITVEQFAQIRNGAEITLRGGSSKNKILMKLGTLNKDLIR